MLVVWEEEGLFRRVPPVWRRFRQVEWGLPGLQDRWVRGRVQLVEE